MISLSSYEFYSKASISILLRERGEEEEEKHKVYLNLVLQTQYHISYSLSNKKHNQTSQLLLKICAFFKGKEKLRDLKVSGMEDEWESGFFVVLACNSSLN